MYDYQPQNIYPVQRASNKYSWYKVHKTSGENAGGLWNITATNFSIGNIKMKMYYQLN